MIDCDYRTENNGLDKNDRPAGHLKCSQKDDILYQLLCVGEERLGKQMGDEGEACPAEEGGDLFQIHPNELVTTIL